MPMYDGNYYAPLWLNDQAPPIDETELRAMSNTIQNSQILSGSLAPTTTTPGTVGQKYVYTGVTPNIVYECVSVENGVYEWRAPQQSIENLAQAYSASATYAAGAYAIYGGVLYRALTDIETPEIWTANHWERVYLANAVSAHVADQSNPHKVSAAQIGALEQTAVAFVENGTVASANHAVNDWIILNGTLYEVTEDIIAGDSMIVGTNIEPIVLGNVVSGHIHDTNNPHQVTAVQIGAAENAIIAPVEASAEAQNDHPAGTYLILGGVLYRATDDIEVGDEIAAGTNVTAAVLGNDLSTHILDRQNPHSVTAAQTGAATAGSLAPVETGETASQAFSSGDYLTMGGVLYIVTSDIAPGDTITVGDNVEVSTVAEGLAGKQTTLTFDATPTSGSSNPVTSGGVYDSVQTRLPKYGMGKNLLDNWYFLNPVNQRGQTVYSATASRLYCIDRWHYQCRYGTVTLNSNGLNMAVTTASSANFFSQTIPGDALFNKQLTVSILDSQGNLRTFPVKVTAKNVNVDTTVTLDGVGMIIRINIGTDFVFIIRKDSAVFDITIQAVKLELGSEQTLCHNEGTDANPVWVLNEIPDYGEELRKCQRYYIAYSIPSGASMAVVGLRGDLSAGTNVGAQIDLPVVMAHVPTVDAALHSIRGNGSNWNTGLSVTATPLSMNANHIAIEVKASNASFPGLTNGYAVLFSKLNLSAEP